MGRAMYQSEATTKTGSSWQHNTHINNRCLAHDNGLIEPLEREGGQHFAGLFLLLHIPPWSPLVPITLIP